MDLFTDRADQLAAYLDRVVGLETLVWVVDRDADMASEFNKATQKKKGLGLIRWVGGNNPDPNSSRLAITSDYNITLTVKPSIRKGMPAGAQLAELAARAIHHWSPEDTPTKQRVRFEVLSCRAMPPVEHYQVHLITARSIVQLSSEPVQLRPE